MDTEQSIRLEVIIVGLITFEIALSLFQIGRGLAH